MCWNVQIDMSKLAGNRGREIYDRIEDHIPGDVTFTRRVWLMYIRNVTRTIKWTVPLTDSIK